MAKRKNEFEELVVVTLNERNQQVVSARELHEKLEVKSKFTDWIKNRIEKYGFEENVDYICISQKKETQRTNGQVGITIEHDYIITINMAKELCMVENNDLGRKFRKYFLSCEEALRIVLFKEGDKKLQIDAMEKLNNMLPEELRKEKVNYIKANGIVNKAVSNYFGFPKSIKKAEMNCEMLEIREKVLNDYVKLFEVLQDNDQVKEILYKKWEEPEEPVELLS